MAAVGGVSGASLTSAAGIESLINQYMAIERQPVTRLQTQKDELQVRRAIYSDIDTKLQALRTAIRSLTGDSDNLFRRLSATSANAQVATVTASQSAATGTYSLQVGWLAQTHTLRSARQALSDQALGLSGSFVIGGAQTRAVADAVTVADTVTGFGTSGVREGLPELGSGRYYVEVRNEAGWQFRLVDAAGKAVTIARADGSGGTTSAWQDLSVVAGTTFDTGRGLKITFGSGDYTAGLAGSGAAQVDYTAQGALIAVDPSHSLNAIRDAINAATYAEGNRVTASVVDRTLILTGSRSGSAGAVQLADGSGSPLATLGVLSRSVADATDLVTTQGVTAFGTADLVAFTGGGLSGTAALAAGRYQVEIGSGADANKFRLLDANGAAVAIAATSGGNTATTDWIAISDGVYDTGRGLTITFQGGGTYAARAFNAGAAGVYVSPVNTTRSPRDAALTINGLTLSRSTNTGLTDLVDGLTFNLTGAGSTQVSVTRDNSQVVSGIKTLVSKLNDVLSYIQAKTEPQPDSKASTGEQTIYKRGPLGSDWSVRRLRRELVNDVMAEFTAAASGAPRRLSDVGLTLDDKSGQLAFSLSNQSALESALSSNPDGVAALVGNILQRVEAHIAPYLDGDYAVIKSNQASIDTQIKQIEGRIKSAEARLLVKEKSLRQQFQGMQGQLVSYGNTYQLLNAYMNIGNRLNQQS
jgi:flagellar capping protein FliD